jgi:hypothetical protein
VIRKHRGRGYLAAFALARVAGLCAEATLQGVAGLLGGDPSRRARARYARAALVAWTAALSRGGAHDPAAPVARLPRPASGADS